MAKMGEVTYCLQLSNEVQIHPVCHVSLLKRSVRPTGITSTDLYVPAKDMIVDIEPLAILEKKVIYQNTLPLTQVLVQWSYLHLYHTTWEYLLDLLKQFPWVDQLL